MRITAKIVGAGLFGDQTRARHHALQVGTAVTLVRDRDNEHDPAATMAMVCTPQGLRPAGYIQTAMAQKIAPDLDAGREFNVRVILGFAAGQIPQIEIRSRGPNRVVKKRRKK